jgi:hypothetical protein
MTTDYERDVEHIKQLYFKGIYDLLDISRIKKFHPDELINIMMDNSMSLRKRDLGGYSAYKLFNDIDRRLQQIEQKFNNRDNDLYEEDITFEEYNNNEFDEYYPHIYNILFDDEDDDGDDYIEYEEEEEEEEDENAETEEEKNENEHAKIEEEKDEGQRPENTDKSVETQTQENNWSLISLLKKPNIENIFVGPFGEVVFFSAVLCNATILLFSVLHLFHDYCKR